MTVAKRLECCLSSFKQFATLIFTLILEVNSRVNNKKNTTNLFVLSILPEILTILVYFIKIEKISQVILTAQKKADHILEIVYFIKYIAYF